MGSYIPCWLVFRLTGSITSLVILICVRWVPLLCAVRHPGSLLRKQLDVKGKEVTMGDSFWEKEKTFILASHENAREMEKWGWHKRPAPSLPYLGVGL